MKNKRILAGSLGLIIVFVLSCSAVLLQGCGTRFYALELHNEGNENIAESSVKYGDRVLIYGNVVAHAMRGYETVTIPIPDSATFYWQYDSGNRMQKTADVRKLVKRPSRFSGSIRVKLMPDGNVEVLVIDE